MSKFVEFQKKYAIIETVRGKGLLLGMELKVEIRGLQAKLIECCFENGLLVYPSVGGRDGTDENGILIAPPFIISNKEMDELLQKLDRSLEQIDRIN
jgi:4-aminobutyrate aminotransferase-like enzyme